jgi:formylglycine-generating enzyme required for sulfatase activity
MHLRALLSCGPLVQLGGLIALVPPLLVGCGSAGGGSGAGKEPTNDAGGSGGGSRSPTSHGGAGTGDGFACTDTAEPSELVSIPAGSFEMGCHEAVDDDCEADELPLHPVKLSAFELEKTEVTQAQYTACVASGACQPPTCDWDCDAGSLPAGCITWAQASAYCAYAGRRLPTEAEWERAARGDAEAKYPWGNAAPDCDHARLAGCGDGPVPVGTLKAGASPFGVLDLAGNVVELVSDWYDAEFYADSPEADPKGPATGMRYGGRGGGFKSEAPYLRVSERDWYDQTDAAASLGFRCAR